MSAVTGNVYNHAMFDDGTRHTFQLDWVIEHMDYYSARSVGVTKIHCYKKDRAL